MPSLFVYQGNDQGALFELEEGTAGLGRDVSNHIRLHDTTVSARHAEVRYNGTQCIVADLDSPSGTFVEGKRLDEPRPLISGDRLQVGSTMMLFTDPPKDPHDPRPEKIDFIYPGQLPAKWFQNANSTAPRWKRP